MILGENGTNHLGYCQATLQNKEVLQLQVSLFDISLSQVRFLIGSMKWVFNLWLLEYSGEDDTALSQAF